MQVCSACTIILYCEIIRNRVAQFSWYSWIALAHEFTSSTKTNYTRNNFPTETENPCMHPRNKSLWISRNPTIHENWIPRNLIISQYLQYLLMIFLLYHSNFPHCTFILDYTLKGYHLQTACLPFWYYTCNSYGLRYFASVCVFIIS